MNVLGRKHRKPCNRKWSYFRKKGHCLMIWIWRNRFKTIYVGRDMETGMKSVCRKHRCVRSIILSGDLRKRKEIIIFHPVAEEKVIFRQRQILIFFFHKSIISGIIFFLRNGLLPTGWLSCICKKNQRMEVGSVRLMVLVIMKRLFCCWRSVHLKNCWSIWNCATCRIISSDRKQAVFLPGQK